MKYINIPNSMNYRGCKIENSPMNSVFFVWSWDEDLGEYVQWAEGYSSEQAAKDAINQEYPKVLSRTTQNTKAEYKLN